MERTASTVRRGTSLAGTSPAAGEESKAGIRSASFVETTTTEIGLGAAAVDVVAAVVGNLSNFDSLEFAKEEIRKNLLLTLWTFDIFTLWCNLATVPIQVSDPERCCCFELRDFCQHVISMSVEVICRIQRITKPVFEHIGIEINEQLTRERLASYKISLSHCERAKSFKARNINFITIDSIELICRKKANKTSQTIAPLWVAAELHMRPCEKASACFAPSIAANLAQR